MVGLSDGASPVPDNSWIGQYSNSYAFPRGGYLHQCWLAGNKHRFELPEGAIQPSWKRNDNNVFGCGLVLYPEDNLAIFFTLNGKLMGELVLKVMRIYKKK
jgi:hypothetical protein